MADAKISALTAATTPLAGTELVPLVQSGTTKKVSVSDLTAGRAVSVSSLASTGAVKLTNGQQLQWETSGGSPAAILKLNSSNIVEFGDSQSSSQAMLLNNGSLTITNGNLIQGTAAKGINFTANTPAAGKTSQLLNWYEEGTWTPNQGSGLIVVGTFGSSGTYTRVGRMITVRGQVTGTTSVAVAASSLICTNLPYAAASGQSCVGGAINDAVSASATILAANAVVYSVQAIGATPGIAFSVTYQV